MKHEAVKFGGLTNGRIYYSVRTVIEPLVVEGLYSRSFLLTGDVFQDLK